MGKTMIYRYSAINTYYRCPKRFEYEYIQGIREEGRNENLEFGTAMHLALSTYLETSDESAAKQAFGMYWDTCSELKFTRYSHADLREKFDTMFERWVKLHAKKYTPKFIEKSIEFTVDNHKFQGTPDFVGLYEGVPSVVDFKTSASIYDKRKIIANDQMLLYAHGVSQVTDYAIQQLVYVVFVKYDNRIQVIKRPLLTQDLSNVSFTCAEIDDKIRTSKPFIQNKESCGYCPHFTRCHGEE
jgi:CRISPR/Cas system-associated exonuclease Cas4 (RecB family)